MPDTTVRYFDSTMTGAPAVSGTAGTLIGVIDACLDTGFNPQTLTSLSVSGNVATATKSSHGFSSTPVLPVIRISGASPSELNGDWRLASIPDANTFTFATTGIGDQTASGTITAIRAPLWGTTSTSCITFTGTNKRAYQSVDVSGSRLFLQVDDSSTTYATVKAYEAMSDVNTGTGSFPVSARYLAKSNGSNSTARTWKLVGDSRIFFLLINSDGSNSWEIIAFGDIASYLSGDAYACWLCASTSTSIGSGSFQLFSGNVTGSDIARSYTQTGSSIGAGRYSHSKSTSIGAAGSTYPNPVDNSFHAWPVELWETTANARGTIPGLWNPLHPPTGIANGTLITDIPQLPGRTLFCNLVTSNANFLAFDVSGPWR